MKPSAIPLRLTVTRLGICLVAGLIFGSNSGQATSVIPPPFPELVNQSDFIVRAVVTSTRSEMSTNGPHRHILTFVTLEVREVIRGTPPQPLVLQMLGGRVGNDEMVVEGAPRFAVGDEDILFLHGNGRQLNPLVALMHGRYPIKREPGTGREYLTRSNGAPLTSELDVAKPMTRSLAPAAQGAAPALSPAEFTSRIKAVPQTNNRPQLEK
jgi:hypothetical protein